MIKSFLNLPSWVRHAFFFSLGVAYACLAAKMSLESRMLPALFLSGMVWVCFYPEILRLYVRYFRAMKVHHLAIVICNHALDLMPDNQLFLQDRHDALMALSGYEEASEYSERAARIAAKFGQRWYGSALAMLWLAAGESATNLAEKAVKLAPRNSFALLMRASVRHSKGDLQGCFEDCARIDPMGKLGGLGRRLSSLSHIELANFEAARDIIDKLPKSIRAGSHDAAALAYFKFSQNQFSEVLTICSQVSDDHSAAYWFLDIQASSYRRLNEGELALKSISRSIAKWPERTSGYEERALVLADAGLLNQALVGCKRAKVLGKKKSSRTAEAYVRFRREEFEEMLDCTLLAMTASPKSAYVRALHSLALAGLGRVDEAMEEAIKATELHSLEALAWYALADAHLKQDQVEQAIKSLDTGLAADPHYRFLYQLRAEAHRRAGHDVEADRDQSKFDQLQTQFMANVR